MADTENVTEKLIEKLKHHIGEAQKIYQTLETIKDITGASIEMPNMGLLKTPGGKGSTGRTKKTNIKSDQFFGKTNSEAAEEYLRMMNHAMPLKEIYDALLKGGVTFKGKDPQKSLYTQLVRATRKFVRIGKGAGVNFGLIDFYPNRVKKKKFVRTTLPPGATKNASEGKTTEETETEEKTGEE